MRSVKIDHLATRETFEEKAYLAANPDVAAAVAAHAGLTTGRQHFDTYGMHENRRIRLTKPIKALRRRKLARLMPHLRTDMPCVRRGDTFDFLTDALREEGSIVGTDAVSANPYPTAALEMIGRHPDGLILDCGAGLRDIYYDGVVNFEIVPYDTTDIVGIGERLPFRDHCFDGVITLAVLEHVRDPFACAREIIRVLKPGGELLANVPFLQPLHGYPHHYYNMTHLGLRALFEPALIVDEVLVPPEGLPIWTLTWFLRSWAAGLPEPAKTEFLSLNVGELLSEPPDLLDRPWLRNLSPEATIELASLFSLRGRAPPA
nr:class I SAM-dependent methyltransferase [uncultured Rhodopila sp.]